MIKKWTKALLDIPQIVGIIKKFGLSSKTEIKNMMKMARRNDISVNFVNKISIREDRIDKIHQNSKYTILKNGAYYVYHYWEKNQELRGNVAVTLPWYGHEGCGFKLFMQTFIYNIPPTYQRGGTLRSTLMWYSRPFRWIRRNWISFKIRNKSQVTRHYPDFWEKLGPVLVVSRNTGWVATIRVITLNVFQSIQNLFERSHI